MITRLLVFVLSVCTVIFISLLWFDDSFLTIYVGSCLGALAGDRWTHKNWLWQA